MKKWKRLSSELVLDNKWFKVQKDVVKLPNGIVLDDYFLWKEPNVCWIVPVTEDNKIILVRQYKHGAGEITIEYPGAIVEENESFLDCAKRELLEETGYTSDNFELVAELFSNPTKSLGKVQILLAKNCVKVADQKLDVSEEIEVLKFSYAEIVKMIDNKDIKFSGTIAATYLVRDKIK